MDRTEYATCAAMLAALWIAGGCESRFAPEPSGSAPVVLAELQSAPKSHWRRTADEPIATTSLEEPLAEQYEPLDESLDEPSDVPATVVAGDAETQEPNGAIPPLGEARTTRPWTPASLECTAQCGANCNRERTNSQKWRRNRPLSST